jgi:hypothetical protein
MQRRRAFLPGEPAGILHGIFPDLLPDLLPDLPATPNKEPSCFT